MHVVEIVRVGCHGFHHRERRGAAEYAEKNGAERLHAKEIVD